MTAPLDWHRNIFALFSRNQKMTKIFFVWLQIRPVPPNLHACLRGEFVLRAVLNDTSGLISVTNLEQDDLWLQSLGDIQQSAIEDIFRVQTGGWLRQVLARDQSKTRFVTFYRQTQLSASMVPYVLGNIGRVRNENVPG